MQKIINHLIQLQELMEARAQQTAAALPDRLEPLDAAIKTLEGELPPEIHQQFMRIKHKLHVGIVPVSDGICTGCGVALPVGLGPKIVSGDMLYACPTCARMLYHQPKSTPRNIPPKKRRSEPPKVGISRFSSVELMVPAMAAGTRDEAIRELAAKIQAAGFMSNADELVEAVLRREAIVSTAVDYGLAFPHARGIEGGGLTLAMGTSKKGIRFDDQARLLTRIIVLLIIPTAASAFYLKLLSGLIETFREKESRDAILVETDPAKMWKCLAKLTKSTIK